MVMLGKNYWKNQSPTNEMLLRAKLVPPLEKAFKEPIAKLKAELKDKTITTCVLGLD